MTKKISGKDEHFDEKFKRLKNAFGAKTDIQLANAMGITQQAVASAKGKGRIPTTWLNRVVDTGVSIDYILRGPSRDEIALEASRNELNNIGKAIPKIEYGEKSQIREEEIKIAKELVELARLKHGFSLDYESKRILYVFVMRQILPETVKKIVDFMIDVEHLKLPDPDDN